MVIKLDEMARVGWIPLGTTKDIEVYVWTNDSGNIPHFHVRKYSKRNKPEWDVPIRYDSADYFFHRKYRKPLPSKKIAEYLDIMLRSQNEKDPERTYWQTAIVAWNNNNSDTEIPYDTIQPDYTGLKVN